MLGLILIILLVLLIVGGWPTFGVVSFGYWPSGIFGVVLVVVLILVLMGRL